MNDQQDSLKLTNEQLIELCRYADSMRQASASDEVENLAFALQAVSLCLHRLQAGPPESVSGPAVDEWYDSSIGQDVRLMWMKVKPVAQKLRDRGLL